jgi:hypothetical protein
VIQTPRFWLDNGHLQDPAAAKAVFWFASRQWQDAAMSCSLADWLGLTPAEFDAYMRDDVLPEPSKRRNPLWDAPKLGNPLAPKRTRKEQNK